MHQAPWFVAEEDVIGLDVGDGVIAASRVKVTRDGSVRLRNAAWAEFTAGASEREMASAIRHVWRSAGMPSFSVCASFRSRSVILRYFRYPALSREEFESAARLEAEESLQLPPEEIVVDWHLNQRSLSAAGTGNRPYEGLLAAAPLKEVRQFLGVLKLAGLYPVVLDLAATALSNLFLTLCSDPKLRADACLLHLTRQWADIAVLFGDSGIYPRTVFARGGGWESSMEHLAEAIRDALKFHEFKLRQEPVRRLVVTGRIPTVPDFAARLGRETGVAVEMWDPFAQIVPGSFRVKRLLARQKTPPPLVISAGLALRRYDDA